MTAGLGHGTEVWSSSGWRAAAESWLDEQLAGAGIERTGEVEQPHLRPWATVLKAPTHEGPVWFKAAGPGTAFEVGLYELLQRVAPGHVLNPIATDVSRGWMVLPDGGTPLAEAMSGADLLEALGTALAQYGELQRELAPHVDSLLALGVSDMRAEIMPTRFDEALEAVGHYVERSGDEADRATDGRVAGLREDFVSWCDQLASAPAAPSLDHNELVALGFVQLHVLEVDVDDPQVLRLRDAYLEPFSDLAPRAELLDALELACRVGKAARALTWTRALSALHPDDVEDQWARAPLESMASLLDGSYLGGA